MEWLAKVMTTGEGGKGDLRGLMRRRGGVSASPSLPSHFDLEHRCLLQMADNHSQRSPPPPLPGAAQIHHWVQTLSSLLPGDRINLLAASNRSPTCCLVQPDAKLDCVLFALKV